MSELPSPCLAFDCYLIDFAGRRLLRDGEPVALEPKAFAVLALLASAPGRALGRDEILDAVWGHRHVTPGVLNRIMTLLRHALGEDAHAPHYLHTLHGVGYRFDLPSAVPSPRPAQSPGTVDAVPPPASPATASPSARPPGRDRGWRMVVLLALLALLAATAAVALWLRPRGPAPAGPPAVATTVAPPTLIVMPLKAIGEEADADSAAGLSDELISALARIQGLRVISQESTGLATAQSAAVPALVPRLGITHALQGSLRQSGERLRFHLRLSEAASGRTLWVQDYDRAAADVLALQREVAQAVATALTLELGLARWPRAGGGDAEFLRRYFAAQALMKPAKDNVDGIERAETEFRQLVRLRPDDARARAGLALALERRAFNHPPLAAGLRAEAALEAALAQRLDPSLAAPYQVQASAACRSNQWERCLQLYERAIASAPSDSQPNFQYAMALAALGYLDRAEALMRTEMERDPINPAWRFGYGRLLDTLGRHAEARLQLDRSAPFSPYARWFNAAWRGDYPGALRLAESMGQRADATRYERIYRASYVAASRALQDPALWPQAEEAMRASEQQTGLMNFLRVLSPRSRPSELVAGLDRVREGSYSTWDLLLWTHDLAHLRRDPAFQEYLRDNGILAYWQRHGYPRQCRPLGEGASCT